MGQPVDHDHEPVGSMDPVEPFQPDARDESIDLVGSFYMVGPFKPFESFNMTGPFELVGSVDMVGSFDMV